MASGLFVPILITIIVVARDPQGCVAASKAPHAVDDNDDDDEDSDDEDYELDSDDEDNDDLEYDAGDDQDTDDEDAEEQDALRIGRARRAVDAKRCVVI